MNTGSNSIIEEDVARVLAHPLPWERLHGSTVLISGAAGFLPAYMVETLATLNEQDARIRVIGLVRNLERARARLGHLAHRGVELVEHDVTQPLPDRLPSADYVIHAASQASPHFYSSDPVGTLEANTFGTSYLLRHAASSKSCSFLFFSSGEVYGAPIDSTRRLTEIDFGFLDSATVRACYGESKRLGETLCVSWAHQHGVPARIVRPFHTYGPGMSLTDGRVFADFVADVVARRDIVLKSDGLAMRPFCYLSDATAGFFTVLLLGESGKAYNVGNPEAEISIRDLAHLMAGLFPSLRLKVTGAPASAGYLQSTVNRSVPDVARMIALGWQPATGLEEGFRRTVLSFNDLLRC